MAELHRCPECGADMAADFAEALCPECLLRQGLCGATGGPETPGSAWAETGSGTAGGVGPTASFTASSRFVPPEPRELASYFPQLDILELLGSGGMGAVYQARQPALDRLVAIKILPPGVARDPSFSERFTREARVLARLSHQHIVNIFDFGWAGDLYYFIMEFVDGMNLRQLIAAGRLEPSAALAIVPQICEALQYAHDEGIVHRDIKPENILIDKKGRVKIADFGLAKLLDRGAEGEPASPRPWMLTGSRQVMGTPHYMAPEQMERPLAVDHRADIYSLGVVFYEMLTGELPIGRFAPPSRKVQVDIRLDDVVLRSLEKEPERRYQQAGEVKTDLESISRSDPTPAARSAPRPVVGPLVTSEIEEARRRVAGPAIGLIVAGVLAGLQPIAMLGFLFTRQFSDEPHLPGFMLSSYFSLALLAVPVAMVVGAMKMLRIRSYVWSNTAGVLALLPLSGLFWPIGLLIGIWALVVLGRDDVKAACRKQRKPFGSPDTTANDMAEDPRLFIQSEKGVGPLVAAPMPLVPPGSSLKEASFPFTSQQSDSKRRSIIGQERLGMDWITINRRLVEADALPPVCMACGGPASCRINRTFSFTPEWVQYLYFVFFLPGVIAEHLLKKEMRVACPLCDHHRNHWSKVVWTASIGWLCAPSIAGLSYMVESVNILPLYHASVIGPALGGCLSLIAWLGVVIYLASTRIHATKITDNDITFERVAEGFVTAMKMQEESTAKKNYEILE